MKRKVLARDLQPGDDIHFGRTVVRVYCNGSQIPKGKCAIIYTRDGDTKQYRTVWNQRTQITLRSNDD